ncbi:MacB family efflux pump subunit [Steroidobacter sp. S1-65]|uniref:MacB family efflux pump subunit n=1 Tax=Steroidobacter gossypii TaxID=2805490 RepID=A0ABS1WUJ3_9GAMM|nr:MacB family efflux pump subunit [Steroidobacter gossypii]MBM0104650.1 MacB family efflux pump subunit [Steroidobacter gossypii]
MKHQDDTPLIRVVDASRVYASGDSEIRALDHASLEIRRGEFVAIMGQSGSGKSTLMNILGCLDRPDAGRYEVNGVDVGTLDPDELAALRRDTFGFVFQRYNLLATVTAAENVELPAIYAGMPQQARRDRARSLLAKLGLGDRTDHRPNQLSGGQQQRVSIARALMNDAEVILADEPTGALDSRSGAEVIALLKQLHSDGRTIILITHDAAVAEHAERILHIKDGRIVEDSGVKRVATGAITERALQPAQAGWLDDLKEAMKMAVRSLRANKFRSALTLLGVMIGVAAVVTMLAIGNGSKEAVMQQIASMGSNLLLVFPGAPGTRPSGDIATLVPADAREIATLDNVVAVSPERKTRATLRMGSVDYQSNITGVWPSYQITQNWPMASGTFVTEDDVRSYATVIVLGQTVARNLFSDDEDPVGKFILVSNTPFEVIGVLASKGANAFGSDMDDAAFVPLSTGFSRLFGQQYLASINVKLADDAKTAATQEEIRQLLISRHHLEDFQIRSTSSFMAAAASTQNTLTLLLGCVAAISLIVGGIGVMNIMLVSVTERTREIGVRMATGARASNILLQFNTEALVVCGIGGVIGVALGFTAGFIAQALGTNVAFTPTPALLALGSALLTGVLFGYLPARKAAYMDPVVALASE